MGVPAELLEDNVILSPTFLIQAGSFINSRLVEYETDYEEQLSNYNYYFEISYIYYVCIQDYLNKWKMYRQKQYYKLLIGIKWL